MKLFPEIAFGDEFNENFMKGNDLTNGRKVGFVSTDSNSLRMVMLAIHSANKHLGKEVRLYTMDEFFTTSDALAFPLMDEIPPATVCLIDLTSPTKYPIDVYNWVLEELQDRSKTLIVFDRKHEVNFALANVQDANPRWKHYNHAFLLSSHPLAVISRPTLVKTVKCDFWPENSTNSMMLVENYMPQMAVGGTVQ